MNEVYGPLVNFTNISLQDFNKSEIEEIIEKNKYSGVYIALSPLFVGAAVVIFMICYGCVILPISSKIDQCINYINYKKDIKKSPIVKNQLNKRYIKKLNKENLERYNISDSQCSICLETIHNKNKIVLDCGHSFDISCIQKWTASQISFGKKPECPLCRGNIVRQEDYINKECNREFIVINVNYDSDSSVRTTLSDL